MSNPDQIDNDGDERGQNSKNLFEPLALLPPQAFSRLSGDWGASTGDWGEARERDDLNERKARAGSVRKEKKRRAFSPHPISPFVPAFLNN